jgi:hypothetical protein
LGIADFEMKKLIIENMHTLAKKKKGVCLSTEYIGSTSKLLWRCQKGHEWEASYRSVYNKSWCPVCVKSKKYTIQDMKELAKKKGGQCLSQKYINVQTKLLWKCESGHQWEDPPRKILKLWCPICTQRKPTSYIPQNQWTIKDMQAFAEKKQGQCLSKKYTNTDTKLLWRCQSGHEWLASPHSVLRKDGTWCPECNINHHRLTIEFMRKIAKKNNGRCLSDTYTTLKDKLDWECEAGHLWSATPDNIIYSDSWCPYCNGIKLD